MTTETDAYVHCGLCGEPTPMLGTRRCNRCWELERRVHADPALACKVFAAEILKIADSAGGLGPYLTGRIASLRREANAALAEAIECSKRAQDQFERVRQCRAMADYLQGLRDKSIT